MSGADICGRDVPHLHPSAGTNCKSHLDQHDASASRGSISEHKTVSGQHAYCTSRADVQPLNGYPRRLTPGPRESCTEMKYTSLFGKTPGKLLFN